MKKRRVLALLLALSLVVSGNGMTVLAAEQGADMPVLMSQEETLPEGDNLSGASEAELSTDGGAEMSASGKEETEKEEMSGEEKEPAEEEKPENSEKPVETESTVPKEDGAGQGELELPAEEVVSEMPVPEVKPAEDEKPEETEPAAPTETDGIEELPDGIEGNDTQEQESDTDTTAYISENHAGIPEAPLERVLPETQAYVSRIVTFTDDTGMQITYDANAEQRYQYVVDGNGVLTAVTVKTDVSGNTIDMPVDFSGNVELKQPTGGKRYTSISSGVFAGNTEVTYVKLPAGVETIGTEAFKGCTSLKGVYLPTDLQKIKDRAFEGCTALRQIAVPKTVTKIEDRAFKGDSKLHLVYTKDADCGLVSIGAQAFEGCSVLAEFCSDTEFLLPSKLESIGEAAFKDCKAIGKIDFKNSKVTEMGKSAFQGCSGLKELSLGETPVLLPEHAFEGCTALAAINFVNGKKNLTIDRWAFAGCYNLKQLVLPQAVIEIRNYAFQGCTKLTRVEIGYDRIQLEPEAFPVGEAGGLRIVANEPSNGYDYARENNLLPDEGAYYKYTVEDTAGNIVEDGKNGKLPGLLGGKVWACASGQFEYEQNINKANNGKGVKSGSEKYYIYYEADKGYTFDASVLRCNGQPMQKESGKYYFTMPEGGVVITAGFLADTPENIKGRTVTVEFSAGTLLQNGEMDQWGYLGVELKEGQTTRMFLLDEDGETIPAAQIVKITSNNEKAAKVSKNGVITAGKIGAAKRAEAIIEVTVRGGDGKNIVVRRTIIVTSAEAREITLKASDYPESSSVVLSGETNGVQTLDITKSYVATVELSFNLQANVYDDTDRIGKPLVWKSSNAKVAALASENTDADNPVNVVTVQKGCEGEATITVTAKNTAVTQKFVIRVYKDGYQLKFPTVTVNPKVEVTGEITLISGPAQRLTGETTVTLYAEKDMGPTKFYAEEDRRASTASNKVFRIRPNDSATIKNGKYKVRVAVNGTKDERKLLPLTVIVSTKKPAPTVKFNTTKAKFNLFYKDGRTSENSEPMLLTTEITNLGTAKIESVALQALSGKANDMLFEENFVIDDSLTDLSTGKVVIRRSDKNNGNLQYTSKKQAAVTGYLVYTYVYYENEGYEKTVVKKKKVTMPTCTKKPSYALRVAEKTYSNGCPELSETLELYDKNSKAKERVVLDAAEYTMTEENKKIFTANGFDIRPDILQDGRFEVTFVPKKGKMKLILKKQNWDRDKNGKERTLNFTYTVKISK